MHTYCEGSHSSFRHTCILTPQTYTNFKTPLRHTHTLQTNTYPPLKHTHISDIITHTSNIHTHLKHPHIYFRHTHTHLRHTPIPTPNSDIGTATSDAPCTHTSDTPPYSHFRLPIQYNLDITYTYSYLTHTHKIRLRHMPHTPQTYPHFSDAPAHTRISHKSTQYYSDTPHTPHTTHTLCVPQKLPYSPQIPMHLRQTSTPHTSYIPTHSYLRPMCTSSCIDLKHIYKHVLTSDIPSHAQ